MTIGITAEISQLSRDEALEEAAKLVELAASEEDSEVGDCASEAFNAGSHRLSMNERLRAWSAEVAISIRKLKSK